MAKLVVISKSHAGLSYQLGRRWVTIGRNAGNMFQINETSVSGQHCEVLFRGKELLVRDMRSTNGTFIKDTLITEGVLSMGGTLRLGDIELRLEGFAGSFPSAGDPQDDDAKPAVPSSTASNGNHPITKRQILLVDDSM